MAAVIKELDRSLKWRAKKLLGLSTVQEALTGAVAAVQRVDSASSDVFGVMHGSIY